MSGPDDPATMVRAAAAKSTLIKESKYTEVLTSRRETDCWGALARGLGDYLEGLSKDWPDGKPLRFNSVKVGWAEPEDIADPPAAAVYSEGTGTYDADSFSTFRYQMEDGRHLQRIAEFVQTYTIDVWTTSRSQRTALMAMLEDALDPVDWMSGFRMILPHYHGTIGSYLKESVSIMDGAEASGKRWRIASLTIVGIVPQIRFIGEAPGLEIRTKTTVTDPSDD